MEPEKGHLGKEHYDSKALAVSKEFDVERYFRDPEYYKAAEHSPSFHMMRFWIMIEEVVALSHREDLGLSSLQKESMELAVSADLLGLALKVDRRMLDMKTKVRDAVKIVKESFLAAEKNFEKTPDLVEEMESQGTLNIQEIADANTIDLERFSNEVIYRYVVRTRNHRAIHFIYEIRYAIARKCIERSARGGFLTFSQLRSLIDSFDEEERKTLEAYAKEINVFTPVKRKVAKEGAVKDTRIQARFEELKKKYFNGEIPYGIFRQEAEKLLRDSEFDLRELLAPTGEEDESKTYPHLKYKV